jgi:hypothetical protein
MPFFAFYGLFAAYLIVYFLQKLPRLQKWRFRGWQYILPLLLAGIAMQHFWVKPHSPLRNTGIGYALPPLATPVTELLEREIALAPGARFNGRVAMYLKNQAFETQALYFNRLNAETGNDHHTTGLWLKHIPTLQEYSQIVTPWNYRLAKRFLSAQDIEQERTRTHYSRFDPRIFRLLGARFILTQDATLPGARQRAALPVKDEKTLRLFELDGANLLGISASRAIVTPRVREAEDRMASAGFTLDTAIVHDSGRALPNMEKLVPVEKSGITIENGAYRIRAKSKGKSLLIVPVEYSHCLEAVVFAGAPELVRADVALTGIVFTQDLDIRLGARTGLFTNPRCRLQDYRDFARGWN